jgi:hypothetical protein
MKDRNADGVLAAGHPVHVSGYDPEMPDRSQKND